MTRRIARMCLHPAALTLTLALTLAVLLPMNSLLAPAAGAQKQNRSPDPKKRDATKAKPTGSLPAFAVVQRETKRYFAEIDHYKEGDILSRSQVETLLKQIALAGWKVSDARAIASEVSADNDFLVGELRTARGQKFMRKISSDPATYDRLNRLAAMSDGKKTVRALIRLPDGDKTVKQLTDSKAGRDVSRRLSRAPTGRHYRKPTGRIYTQSQLTARLKTSYLRDAAKAAEKSNR